MITPSQPGESTGRLVACATTELKPHCAFTKFGLSRDARKLSMLAAQGESAFAEPIVVSQKLEIVGGFELWHLATLRQRPEVLCLQLTMSEEETLQRLIRSHQRFAGFNDFDRILLALELEPLFREQARSNQQLGGQLKGSSNLSEADRLKTLPLARQTNKRLHARARLVVAHGYIGECRRQLLSHNITADGRYAHSAMRVR